MRKQRSRISIPSQTLQRSPYTRQRGEESEKAGVPAVALRWIVPVVGVEAEEELDVGG